jgi:hypothetical protein
MTGIIVILVMNPQHIFECLGNNKVTQEFQPNKFEQHGNVTNNSFKNISIDLVTICNEQNKTLHHWR